jgi:hypothetical protein
MKSNGELSGLERLLRPLSQNMTTELAGALVELTADNETQVRYDALAEKKNQGTLTLSEEEELASLVRANTLIGLLKAEAQLLLNHTKPA